ncbi:hypothetical protein LPC08_13040 [Roseomonas sp. OT10]|uniref:tripartite tricarboxylate transporter substrate-binding protein n=1 Tax=Roseomonas cutis TaxID=2897332 RepID=UPI001E55D17A|nr:tripartite tricarboxylate transporter substrate-binding protein [Roseomonas sp. OT10]UFN46957.1 hypothetical protein LPC08_13040 [Roseomonas sp. OT10]
MRTGRRGTLLGLGAVGAALLAPRAPARAAPTVTLLVPGPEGGSSDQWLRAFAPFLERHLPRRSVTVLARPGANGLAMLRELAEARPDGRLLGYIQAPEFLTRAVEQGEADLLSRLRFLGAVTEEPLVLVTPPGTELAALRALPSPGVLGLPPPNSVAALAATAVIGPLNLSALHFPSAAAARQAALSGNVSAALVRLSDAIAALRDGKLSALGLSGEQRSPLLPEAPTLAEQGLPLRSTSRRGFVLPAGIAEDQARPLTEALRQVVEDPEFAAQSQATGLLPSYLDGAAWTAAVQGDLAALQRRWVAEPWTPRPG